MGISKENLGRSGRLIYNEGIKRNEIKRVLEGMKVYCSKCGKEIAEGNLCEECMTATAAEEMSLTEYVKKNGPRYPRRKSI